MFVHVYRVVDEWVVEVKAGVESEMLARALRRVRDGEIEGRMPGHEYVAVIPGGQAESPEAGGA